MAKQFGDPTAQRLGRLHLTAEAHRSVGTLLYRPLAAYACPFLFGWAKPVPVYLGKTCVIPNATWRLCSGWSRSKSGNGIVLGNHCGCWRASPGRFMAGMPMQYMEYMV